MNKNKLRLRLAASVMATALLLTGCSKETSAEVEDLGKPVEITQIQRTTIVSEQVYAGQVNALESVSVVSSGKVEAIYFDVGDRVNKGDILFMMDKEDAQNSIRQLEASLATANAGVATAQTALNQVTGGNTQSNLSRLENVINTSESGVINARSALEAAEISLNNAQLSLDNITTTYENAKVLYSSGAMSKTDFDTIELQYNQAVSSLNQMQLKYEDAVLGLHNAETAYNQAVEQYNYSSGAIIDDSKQTANNALNSAIAQRNAISVQLDIARNTLNDLNIDSPISGVITARNVEAGGVTSASLPAFVVENIDVVTVDVNVSESIINEIYPGLTVDLTIKSLSNETIKGIIKTISPSANATTSTYPVRIEIDNANGFVKPGMFAEVRFIKEQSDNTIVVPRNTVLEDESIRYVYVNNGGVAKRVTVETGIDNGAEIEIISGITENDQVVTKGQTNIIDGDKLNIVVPSSGTKEEDASEEN